MEKRRISSKEMDARLDMADEVNKNFPFLKGHYKVRTHLNVDGNGDETGTLSIELFNKLKNGDEINLGMVLTKYLNVVLDQDIKKSFDKVVKENKKLKTKLKKHEKKV